MRYFIVINTSAGRQQTDSAQTLIAEVLMAAHAEHEFLLTRADQDINAVAQLGAFKARTQHGAVVAVGGDGTINAVASAALDHDVPFGVIPQGTFNYYGREHGIPQDAEAATRALLGARVERQQVGWVNKRLFLINASLGLYARVQEERETYKRQFGRSRVTAMLAGLLTLLAQPRKLMLEIETDGRFEVLATPSLFVANNRLQMGRIGLDEPELDALENGRLAAIVVKPTSGARLFALALRGALGRLSADENISSFSFKRMQVRPRRDKFLKVSADGEVQLMRTPLVFSVGPRALKLLLPAEIDRVAIA